VLPETCWASYKYGIIKTMKIRSDFTVLLSLCPHSACHDWGINIVSWVKLFCSLVIWVYVLHYQSSCHKCLHFMTFKIVAAKILFQYWMQKIHLVRNSSDTITV
jgi:hypothetical protein